MAEIEVHDEVESWLDSLSRGDWERVVVIVDRLGALASSARMPFSRSLGDGLFELRFTLGRTARRITYVMEEEMGNYSRWEDMRERRGAVSDERRDEVEQDLALGQLVYDLRTAAGLSQRELAVRMKTTQSVISRLEEGGGARNRIDTLARLATALGRHLVLSFPQEPAARTPDSVQVA
ncbi:helix-turn-helix domain-containing protein [Microbacterium sp. X-17]|uniref:helix-turn-helix domain-containing protein n=1 Tax=Microbacterium sp. X-17 TaxID=3144404 RepID=UPI0031F5B2B8